MFENRFTAKTGVVTGGASGIGVLRSDLQNGRIVLDLAESAEAAPLVGLIVQNGGQVEEVRKDKGSLEDVFLTLMEEEA